MEMVGVEGWRGRVWRDGESGQRRERAGVGGGDGRGGIVERGEMEDGEGGDGGWRTRGRRVERAGTEGGEGGDGGWRTRGRRVERAGLESGEGGGGGRRGWGWSGWLSGVMFILRPLFEEYAIQEDAVNSILFIVTRFLSSTIASNFLHI
jgi:hypothetical protein